MKLSIYSVFHIDVLPKPRILLTITFFPDPRDFSVINLVCTNVVSRNESYRPNSDPYVLMDYERFSCPLCRMRKLKEKSHY